MKVTMPPDTTVDAEVDLGTNAGGYLIQARLNVALPGLDRETAQKVVDAAHEACPYSKATRGNINAVITLNVLKVRVREGTVASLVHNNVVSADIKVRHQLKPGAGPQQN
nr:hypothetical protein [Tanacetum cinerariifolium]